MSRSQWIAGMMVLVTKSDVKGDVCCHNIFVMRGGSHWYGVLLMEEV